MNIDINAYGLLSKENKDSLKEQINLAVAEKIKSKQFIAGVTDNVIDELLSNYYDYFSYDKVGETLSKFVEDAVTEKIKRTK
jgi:hypothetical protein